MPAGMGERVLALAGEVRAGKHYEATRLTILKKWFAARPLRLPAVAVWIGSRAVSTGAQAEDEVALFAEGRRLLDGCDEMRPTLDQQAARDLHKRLRDFQNDHTRHKFGLVREIKNWDLFLLEQALAIYLGESYSTSDGYKIVADAMKKYDPSWGTGLNRRSADDLEDLGRFLVVLEAREAEETRSSQLQ